MRRPPVIVWLARAGVATTLSKRRCLSTNISAVDWTGNCAHSKAATPLTCGAAMLVPSNEAYEVVEALVAEKMFTPGAPRWTLWRPVLEKLARLLLTSIAATERTFSTL